MAEVTFVPNPAGIEALIAGPVAAYIAGKAAAVAELSAALCPHRSGHLAASIAASPLPGLGAAWKVGSTLPYARVTEDREPYLVPALEIVFPQ